MCEFLRIFTSLLMVASALTNLGCKTNISMPENPSMGSMASQAENILQNALKGQRPKSRSNATEVVVSTGLTKYMPTVAKLLDDPSPQVRFTAAIAVADTNYNPARPELRQLKEDKDPSVRLAAIYALDKLNSANALPDLKEATDANNQKIRANTVLLLGKLGSKKALPVLYKTLRDQKSQMEVRFQTVEAIARLGDRQIYEKIWTMLISAYADDRVRGIKAMSALATTRAENAISTMLKDPILEVRIAAAEELAKLGNNTGQEVVLKAFRKNEFDKLERNRPETARVMATLAIGQICTQQLKPFLSRMLNNSSAAIRLAAAKSTLLCMDQ